MRLVSLFLLLTSASILLVSANAAPVPESYAMTSGTLAPVFALDDVGFGGTLATRAEAALQIDDAGTVIAWAWVLRLGKIIQGVWRSERVRRTVGWLISELAIDVIVDEITRLLRGGGLSRDERETLQELQRFVVHLEASIRRNQGDIAAIKREMEQQYNYTMSYLIRLEARLSSLDERLTQAEINIRRLIREGRATRAELRAVQRTIIDHENRIVELEDAVVDHEGRILSLEGRVLAVEDLANANRVVLDGHTAEIGEVWRKINRDDYYNKHVFGIGGHLLYSNAVSKGHEGMMGAAFELSYLFNSFFGIFAQGAFTPVRAGRSGPVFLSTDSTRTADIIWDNYAVYAGAFVDLIPGENPVTFRLGVGGGIMINELIENPSDAGFFGRSESVSIEKRTNPALLICYPRGLFRSSEPVGP